MSLIVRILAHINDGVFYSVGFVCAALGIPDGRSRRVIEYIALLGSTTVVVTAVITFAAAIALAGLNSLTSMHAAANAWWGMFSWRALEIFGSIAFIFALLAVHFPSKRYQQPDA